MGSCLLHCILYKSLKIHRFLDTLIHLASSECVKQGGGNKKRQSSYFPANILSLFFFVKFSLLVEMTVQGNDNVA
jgi:hypothetical protein